MEIRLYLEGGGSDKELKASFRRAMQRFLGEIHELARQNRGRLRVIVCGSRNDAWRAFRHAELDHPDAHNILLVDSEGPVVHDDSRRHLQKQDGWTTAEVRCEQCHLMVQIMEAWFLADPQALEAYYGNGFTWSRLPDSNKVERIAKADIEKALSRATRASARGPYRKRHAPAILERLNCNKVCASAPHCDRLVRDLFRALQSTDN